MNQAVLLPIVFLCAFTGVLQTSWATDNSAVSKQLLELFGSQCKSVGTYTQNAVARAEALTSVFNGLISDRNCGATNGMLNHLTIFQQQIQNNKTNQTGYDMLELEKQVEELTLALGDTSDPDLVAQISDELVRVRLDLLTAKAAHQAYNSSSVNDRQMQGYYYAGESLKNFFQVLPQIQNCSNAAGRSMIQLLGNGLSVGSYFVNPAMSAAMSGAASITTAGLDSLYTVSKRVKIYRQQDVNLPTALSCSAESLTDMYCETLRAERVVKRYAQWEEDQTPMWKGIPFIFRRLPPLLDWLELVRAGSPASDSYDAQRRLEIMQLDTDLNDLKQVVDGFISDTDREMRTLSIDLDNYIMTKLEHIANTLIASKPISTLNGTEFIPFRLIGFSDVPMCSFQGVLDPCQGFQNLRNNYFNGTDNPGYRFTLRDWDRAKEYFRIMYSEGRNFVNQQISRVINEDQENVLAQAYEGYSEKMPPIDILKRLFTYMQETKAFLNRNNQGNRYSPQLLGIESTQVIVKEVIDELEKWMNRPLPSGHIDRIQINDEASKVLSKVYDLFNLRTGNRYLSDRIKSIVRWDLTARMQNGDFDRDLDQIVRLSNNNIINDITAYKLFNLQDMVNDIDNAKGVLKAAIGTYFKEMDRYYKKAFNLIRNRSLAPEVKNKLCIHLLASDFISNSIGKGRQLRKACRGVKMQSIFGKANLTISFDDHINYKGDFITDFNQRVCLYNDFMRQVSLREQHLRSTSNR